VCPLLNTVTNIYSLGVLAYELLTGSTPFDRERLRAAALDELLRMIRDEEPPKPSTRISSLGQTATSLSLMRKTDPKRLLRMVRGDLDWIVMKALEKDRVRRYETASELAADVQRYLDDERVLASPPSAWYRLRRSLRRHRGLVLAAGLLLFCLLAGIAGTAWGLVNARRERDLARETLVRLKEEQESMAIMHAMNGNVVRMQQSVRDARTAGATEGWAKSVEAIPAIFSGEGGRALALLEEARQAGEDTLAVHGLLGLAHACVGDPHGLMGEFSVLCDRLKNGKPQRFQDKLFCAMFLTYFEPHGSFELADEAFDEGGSPVALAVRSTARTILACDTQDIAQAEQAVAEASAASAFLPNSPLVLDGLLSSHLMALYIGRDTEDEDIIRRHCEAGRELADRLAAFPRYASGTVAVFYEEIGDVAQARRQYELILKEADTDFQKSSYIAFLLRQNEIDHATEMLSEIPLERNILDEHVIVAADHEEMRTDIRERLVEALREPSWLSAIHVRSLAKLCLLGYGECATSEAARIAAMKLETEPLHREIFLFFAGESTKDELYRLAGSRSRAQCMVHFFVGCRLLGQRDREGARAEFAKCRGMIGLVDYEMVRTILKRMDDPDWPGWMSDPKPSSRS
jgi:hypothetical protein